jgi:hypothetical protein
MKDVVRATESIFGVNEKVVAATRTDLDPPAPQDFVDALGEPIDATRFIQNVPVRSPEEVWGVEAARIAQSRISQARRFREWALE